MDRVLAVITARSGSKTIIDKNLQKIGDYSLLEWTAACISKCPIFYDSIISTDSPIYAEEVSKYNVGAPFLRPKEIAQDSSTDLEVFTHLVSWLEENSQVPEWIAHFRPTTPFRDPSFVNFEVSNFMLEPGNREWTALRSVHLMSESAYKFFELDQEQKLVSIFMRNPDLDQSNMPKETFPRTYLPNGYVDLINTEHFLSQRKLHGNRVKALITEPALEIDCKEDLVNANLLNSTNRQIMKLVF